MTPIMPQVPNTTHPHLGIAAFSEASVVNQPPQYPLSYSFDTALESYQVFDFTDSGSVSGWSQLLRPVLDSEPFEKVRECIKGYNGEQSFISTLKRSVRQTITLLFPRIHSISIDLADLQSLDTLSWQQIDLIVCLTTAEYQLAETLFSLSENIFGKILETTGFFFTTTILSQQEYQPKTSHLVLAAPPQDAQQIQSSSPETSLLLVGEENVDVSHSVPDYLYAAFGSI